MTLTNYLFFFWVWATHPIHLSLTEVQHNTAAGTLEITHRIFIDDLEAAIEQQYHIKSYLASNKEIPGAEKYIRAYVEQKFILYVDGKPVKLQIIGTEYETDAVWVYVEASQVPQAKNFRVVNKILLDLYEDQTNIVSFKANSQKKSLRLGKDNESGDVAF